MSDCCNFNHYNGQNMGHKYRKQIWRHLVFVLLNYVVKSLQSVQVLQAIFCLLPKKLHKVEMWKPYSGIFRHGGLSDPAKSFALWPKLWLLYCLKLMRRMQETTNL